MNHMNPKMVSLLREGFSINTLENLSESQINVLYRKLNEQKGSVKMKTGATPEQIKQYTDKGVNVEIGEEEEVTEKSVSKKQHGLMGAAYSVEKGDKELKDIPKSYRNKVKKVVDSMSKKQVKDFAKTKTSKLPEKVETKENDEIKKLEESILKLIENHLPPHTTKGELLKVINKKR
jgi:Protein of unknwon function (DUF3008)